MCRHNPALAILDCRHCANEASLDSGRIAAEREAEEAQGEAEELRAEIAKLRAALDESNRARGEIGPLKARIAELNAELDRSEREIATLRALFKSIAETAGFDPSMLPDAGAFARTVEERFTTLRARVTLVEELRERIARLESDRDILDRQVAAANVAALDSVGGKARGYLNALAILTVAPPEQAMHSEAWLGLQAIIARLEADARAHEEGRAAALDGRPCESPYTDQRRIAWRTGWLRAAQVIAAERAEELARADIKRLESDARDYEETIAANRRDYETLAEALRERIAGLESERAAMGAALGIARDVLTTMAQDAESRGAAWSLTARVCRDAVAACQPHALESAAAVLRAAGAYLDAIERRNGHNWNTTAYSDADEDVMQADLALRDTVAAMRKDKADA